MTTLREAAQFALDALHCPGDSELMDRVEQKLRAALAEQPAEQEPGDARYALAMLVDPEKLEPWQLELYDKAMTAPQPDDTGRDWSLLEATQESLREHMAIIQKDTALLRQALEALKGMERLEQEAEQELVGEVVEVAQCYDERWTAIIETGSVELQKGDKVYTAPQPTIPPGYKLVPLEPTTQMRQAVCNCHDIDHQEQIVEDYRAMLAAAPEAPQPAKRIPLTDEEIEAVEQSFKHGWHHIDFARAIIAAYERKNGIEG